MNYQYGRNAITSRNKETGLSSALALAVALALAFPGSAALADGEPIPGVDVNLGKDPGGIIGVVPRDASGKFSVRLPGPGKYTLSTSCRQQSCSSHTITAQYSGVALKPGADGSMTYEFTVGSSGPFVLSGEIQNAAGVRVATGDVNGDGRPDLRAANPSASGNGKPSFKVADNESPRPQDRILSGDGKLPGISNAGVPPIVRAEGITELVGDNVRVAPKGADGKPALLPIDEPASGLAGTAIPQANITIFLNTNITSRLAPITNGENGKPGSADLGTRLKATFNNLPASTTIQGTDGTQDGTTGIATTTDAKGAFKFTRVPAGNYTLSIAGKSPEPVTVGADGTINGEVSSGPGDGSGTRVFRITNVRVNARNVNAGESPAIWDRWGNGAVPSNTTPPKVITGKGNDKFDALRSSGISGSPGSPGTTGSPGYFGGFGGSPGPGGSAMGPGAGSPAGPMGR